MKKNNKMQFWLLLLALGTSSSFTAIAADRNANFKLTKQYIKQRVEASVKDSDSLKWKGITIGKDGKYGCATFNGKNSYGAYAGYETVGYIVLPDSIGVRWPDKDCYAEIEIRDYYLTPEGKAALAKQEADAAKAKELQAQEQAQREQDRAQILEENRLKAAQEEEERIAANEAYNRQQSEKDARDKAEMDELLRIEREKGKAKPTVSAAGGDNSGAGDNSLTNVLETIQIN